MHDDVRTDPTGRTFRRGLRRVTVHYGGLSKEIDSPGWWPDDGADDDGIIVGSDMDVWDAALEELKRRVAARDSGDEASAPAAE